VGEPGRLPFTGGEKVLDVIHFAGGLLPTADRTKIRLIRSFPPGSPVQVLPIDYEEITMGTDPATNYQIVPNDRLVVPRDFQESTSAGTGGVRRGPQELPKALQESRYFPSSAKNDPTSESLNSTIRKLDRRMGDLEKKLDTILERLKDTKPGLHRTGPGQRVPLEPGSR
jgi:hypothetical protein